MSEQKKRVPCLVFSRVVGYITPVQNWNKGKRQEWRERRVYRPVAEKSPDGDPVDGLERDAQADDC